MMDICPLSGKPCLFAKCIHVTEVNNYTATDVKHLCVVCGSSYLVEEQNSAIIPPQEVVDFIENLLGKQPALKKCPSCGYTIEHINQTGKLGCAECYETFKEEIKPIILNCQKSLQHKGKSPKASLKQLEAALKTAIKEENYELAGKIKEQMKKLQ